MLVAVLLMAGSSMATVIDVFGMDWTTNPEASIVYFTVDEIIFFKERSLCI